MTISSQQIYDCDLLVVGGGINGTGIARDAAGRGLSVVLCEKDDLASHTSSASSKLIHGGLRYLEHYEFRLVRKALIEREVLMRLAPHLISPLNFVMPYVSGMRPRWMLRAGLFLYDHLAHREILPSSQSIQLRKHEAGAPLKSTFTSGFMYADAWVDDARLVVLNAMDAAERGAKILTRMTCESIQAVGQQWRAQLVASEGEQSATSAMQINARCIVNATGSWAVQFQEINAHHVSSKNLRLIKGSHIVVKRLFDHHHAYIFQHTDGRIVFAIPYERDFTLIGTTDIEYHGDMNQVAITPDEINYLCELSSLYFEKTIKANDVMWSFAGVRPLVDDGAKDAKSITRDYILELDHIGPAMLHVFGGKVTTYRRLAEDAMSLLAPILKCPTESWTASSTLPGGDINGVKPSNQAVHDFDNFVAACQRQYSWLPSVVVKRYAHAYGTRMHQLLKNCTSITDMGEEILGNLYEKEVRYLMAFEFAKNAQDILWRRSKLGLHLPPNAENILDHWVRSHCQA